MPAAKADFYIEQGATFVRELQWVNRIDESTVVPYDLTGTQIHMQVRKSAQSPMIIEASTIIGNIVITDAPQGKFRLKLTPAVTSLLTVKEAMYDIEVVYDNADQDTYRILEGAVTVSQNITQLQGEPVLS